MNDDHQRTMCEVSDNCEATAVNGCSGERAAARSRHSPAAGRRSLVAVLLIGASACGDDPTTPDPRNVTSVLVTAPRTELAIGESVSAEAEARTADGSTVETTFVWSSSVEAVATVSDSGEITALAEGTATITAAAAGISGELAFVIAGAPSYIDLTAMVDSVRAEFGLPAMGGAIVTVSDGAWALGVAGTQRIDSDNEITVSDRWHLGSNLKAMTSALAAIAVDQQRIEWTTTIVEAFPALQVHPELETVTLEELLSQQSGISDTGWSWGPGPTAKQQRDAAVASGIGNPPGAERGTYNYTNMSYVIAAAMIERAWDGVYEDLIQDKLWGPLGVTGAGWGPTDGGGADNQTVGHTWIDGGWVPCQQCDNPPGLSAAGRAYMPLDDWARVIQEFMRAGTGTSSLISAANGSKLMTPHVPIPSGDNYGLGWRVTTRSWGGGTDETVTHGGSNIRHHSTAWVGLGSGVAFIATTNSYRAQPAPTTLAALNELIVRMLNYYQSTP